jgi:alkanesulfonate monooxygenase SsuD/methylene tetrahydromethanopterin reductase-like flavin-dependent oxidoreductase (luciferase family)
MAATLDVITKGRFELGIGSGWSKTDYDTCGLPYPRASVRIAQLEEAVQIIKKMWTEVSPTFQGKHYWIKDAQCPQPVQTPHPPIMIAGGGEKLLLKVVAKHANICLPNFSAFARVADMGRPEGRKSYRTVDECKHKFAVLCQHCEAVGRDVSEIEKMWSLNVFLAETPKGVKEIVHQAQRRFPDFNPTVIQKTGILGTPDEAIKRIQEYIDLGVTYFDLGFFDLPQDTTVKLFAKDVMPYFTEVS